MIFVGKLNQNFYLEPRVATRDQMRRVWEYLNFSTPPQHPAQTSGGKTELWKRKLNE